VSEQIIVGHDDCISRLPQLLVMPALHVHNDSDCQVGAWHCNVLDSKSGIVTGNLSQPSEPACKLVMFIEMYRQNLYNACILVQHSLHKSGVTLKLPAIDLGLVVSSASLLFSFSKVRKHGACQSKVTRCIKTKQDQQTKLKCLHTSAISSI